MPAARRQMPHADLATHLLCDVSPATALQWCSGEAIDPTSDTPVSIPPKVYRATISYMLRVSTHDEARDAFDTLKRILCLEQEKPGTCFGFEPDEKRSEGDKMTNARELYNVLYDLLTSAAGTIPLLQSSPALTFYNTAGPGTAEDDFSSAPSDRRPAYCTSRENLSDVRAANLALGIRYFAAAFEYQEPREMLLKAVWSNPKRILQPLTIVLADHISSIQDTVFTALHEFYDAYARHASEDAREMLKREFVGSVMSVARNDPEMVVTHVGGLPDTRTRLDVCRLCLIQRFGVQDDHTRPMSLDSLMEKYLKVRVVKGRQNSAVPVLLAFVISGWCELASKDQFFEPELGGNDSLVAEAQDQLTKARRRISRQFGAPERDIACLKFAVMALAHRILGGNP